MYSDVKIGDEFLLSERYSKALKKVTKVTPKRFYINTKVFNKSDGSEHGGSTFHYCFISKMTEDERKNFINEVKRKRERQSALEKIIYFDFKLLEIEDIKTIVSIIDKTIDKSNNG